MYFTPSVGENTLLNPKDTLFTLVLIEATSVDAFDEVVL